MNKKLLPVVIITIILIGGAQATPISYENYGSAEKTALSCIISNTDQGMSGSCSNGNPATSSVGVLREVIVPAGGGYVKFQLEWLGEGIIALESYAKVWLKDCKVLSFAGKLKSEIIACGWMPQGRYFVSALPVESGCLFTGNFIRR